MNREKETAQVEIELKNTRAAVKRTALYMKEILNYSEKQSQGMQQKEG